MVFELHVLEGRDVGHVYTLNTDSVTVGRGDPDDAGPDRVLLTDATVSVRQAKIRSENKRLFIEHLSDATNPTVVNGRSIQRQAIAPGDRIQMGRVVMELQAREGFTLSGDHQIPDDATRSHALPSSSLVSATVAVPALGKPQLQLTTVRGGHGSFAVGPGSTKIGRGLDCDVRLDDTGVSRVHAELLWEGPDLWLIHRSKVNATCVNGVRITERRKVRVGDVLEFAHRVALRLDGPAGGPAESSGTEYVPLQQARQGQAGGLDRPPSLGTLLERRALDEDEIEEYRVTGSFLDVDVVRSYDMKATSGRAEHIIISFKRWRAFTTAIVQEHRGEVLSSNGDEIMCFFESPADAVTAGREMLRRLGPFNETQNLLPMPFNVRIGVHSGTSLIDRRAGVAFSPVLDIAGHLQKAAPPGGLLISADSFEALPEKTGFTAADRLEREGILTYRLNEP